jgi:hypothetical protein
MSRSLSLGRGLLLFVFLAGAINGCGCDEEPVATAALAFLSPAPGNQMRLDADKDANPDNGFQVDVVLKATGFLGSGTIKLTNTGVDGAPVLEAEVGEDGRATLVDVTLQLGSNQLQASLSHGGPTLTVEASYEVLPLAAPECNFVNVDPNTVFGSDDDKDANTPGMQANISVACSGQGVEDGAQVGLNVAGSAAALSGTLSGGRTTFANTTLPEGEVVLSAHLVQNNEQVATASVTFLVDSNRCVANVTSPANSTAILALADLEPGTPEVADIDVVVNSTNCGAGSEVGVVVEGQPGVTAGAIGSDGNATIRLQLGQGPASFYATVADGTGAGKTDGRSLEQVHLVDTVAPALTAETPVEGAVLVADTDTDADPANGHNSVAVLRLTDGDDVPSVFAVIDADEANKLSESADAFGVVRFNLTLGAGDHSIVFSATDPAGNVASVTRNVTVDMVIPTVVLVAPATDGTLLADADADLETAGFQINCGLRVDGFESVSGLQPKAFCSARAADQEGEFNGAWADSALVDFAVDGTATVPLTLADGRYEVVAGVWTRDGAGNRAISAPPRILVIDGTAPTLTFVQPTDGAFLNSATTDLELSVTDAEPGQPVSLTVGGEVLVLDPAAAVDSNGRVVVSAALLSAADPADGSYVLGATVLDLAGNLGTAAPVTVTIDTAAPLLRVFGLDGDVEHSERVLGEGDRLDATEDANLDWGGNIADGLQYGFRVEVGNEVVGTSVSLVLNGVAPVTAPTVLVGERRYAEFTNGDRGFTLPDGANRIEITVGDAAGNSSEAGIGVNVTTGNRYVRVTTPADGSSTNAQTLTVDGISNLDAGTECTLSASSGGAPVTQASAVQAGGTLRWTGVALAAEGVWALTVSCRVSPDPVTTLAPTAVTIDRTAPTLAFVGLPDSGVFNSAAAPDSTAGGHYRMNLVVSAAANATCTVDGVNPTATLSVVGGGVDALYENPVFTAGANCSFTFAAVSLADQVNDPDSEVVLRASGEDAATNAGSITANVVVDREGPSVNIADPLSDTQLGAEQDSDAFVPGLQYSVIAAAAGADVNTTATLFSGQEQLVQAPAGANIVFPAITIADGTHTLRVVATDDHGNSGEGQSTNVQVDGTAPAIEIIRPNADAVYNALSDTNPQLAGHQLAFTVGIQGVQLGSTVEVRDAGQAVLASALIQGVTVEIANVTVPEGAQTLTVYVSDGVNSATETVSIIVDTQAPSAQAITVVGNDAVRLQTRLVLNVAEDEDVNSLGFQGSAQVNVSGAEVGATLQVLSNSPVPGTVVGAGVITGDVDHTVSVSLPEGIHQLTVRTRDAADNYSASNAGAEDFLVDTVAPVISVTAPGNASTLLVVDDTDVNVAGLQFTLRASTDAEAGTSVSFRNGVDELGAGVVANGAAEFATILPEGAISLSAVATDQAGNATTSGAITANVDSVAPTVAITSPVGGATLGDAQDVDDLAPGLQVDVGVITGSVADGQTLTVRSTVGGDRCSASTSGAPLTIRCTLLEGANQNLTASVSDVNGNIGNSAGVTVSVDLTAPSLTFVEPAANPARLNAGNDIDADTPGFQTRFRLSSDADGQTVSLTIAGVPAGDATVQGGLAIFSTVTLDEGSYAVHASVSDAQSNTSEVDITVSVDLTAPTLLVVSPAANPVTYTTDDDQIAGAPLDTNMTVTIGGAIGGTVIVTSDIDNQVATANVAADGNLVLTGVQLSNVNHSLTFTVTDPNGNSASTMISANVDVVAPADFVISGAVQSDRSGTVRLTWTEPGDDADSGIVTAYDVRTSTSAIGEQNFDAAASISESVTPVGGGEAIQVDVAGLPFDTANVRLAAKALDDVGNDTSVTVSTVNLELVEEEITPAGTSTKFGWSMCAGDFNNDGMADLVVTDRSYESDGQQVGAAFIFMGAADLSNITPSLRVGPAAGSYFGNSCTAGDFNNDGFADLVVGAHGGTGAVYVYNGSAAGVSATVSLTITGNSGSFGYGLSAQGSVVGDDRVDLAISAFKETINGVSSTGKIYFFDGTTLTQNRTFSDAAATVEGHAGGRFGISIASGRDVTGDGIGDFVGGAYYAAGSSGEIVVVPGPIVGSLNADSAGVIIASASSGTKVGYRLAVGDFVGDDGVADIVAAHGSGTRSIRVYVGGLTLASGDEDLNVLLPASAPESFQQINQWGLCNLDHTGNDDLLIGGELSAFFYRGATTLLGVSTQPDRSYTLVAGRGNGICPGDMNNDGKTDFALVRRVAGGSVMIRH